jgi:DNA-binding PadR family transcriptional regulator
MQTFAYDRCGGHDAAGTSVEYGMALSHAIMTALIEDEMSGYDLARAFDSSIGFFWQASHQQIYRELRRLSEQGLVTGRSDHRAGKPDRKLYALTQRGREALDAWVLEADRGRLQESKDDLYIKLYNLSPASLEHLRATLLQRREAMMQRLYLYQRIRMRHYDRPEKLPLRRRGVYLALLGGIMQGESYLAWCDQALDLLARSAAGADDPA